MRILLCSVAMASGALLSSAATAQSQPQQQTQHASATSGASDPVICEKEEEVGTRLGGHKVCMRRSQWQDRQLQDRKDLEKAQAQRTIPNGG